MINAVIVFASRTPVGRYLGSLKTVSEEDLLAKLLANAMDTTGLSKQRIDQIIIGNVLSIQPNIARVSSLLAGFPEIIPAYTVNRLCASSLQTVINATQAIQVCDASVVIAGGTENMSRAPYYIPIESRFSGLGHGNAEIIDSFVFASNNAHSHLYHGLNMGISAENIAWKYGISRQQQDEFAFNSQQKYVAAQNADFFFDEVVPVEVPDKKSQIVVSEDEHPRPETTIEKLSKLKPAFIANGTVTAGNSSGMNDGASAVIIMSDSEAINSGVKPLARVVSYASVGIDPKIMGLGVVPATLLALKRAELSLKDIDLVEINEAFAVQVLGCLIELGVQNDAGFIQKLNVNGGAIAHGHALGNSGTRMLVTMLNELKRRGKKYGLVTMCVGGGQGVALIVENMTI
jgi:acetyl-CoA C-acetyltransferase